MPETSFSVSSNAFSGQMRPSKPSGMPMTFHPYLIIAALVAARMTAFRPGASPPPVPMPIQRMSDIDSSLVVGRWSLVVGRRSSVVGRRSSGAYETTVAIYDNTSTAEDDKLLVGVELCIIVIDRLRRGGQCG